MVSNTFALFIRAHIRHSLVIVAFHLTSVLWRENHYLGSGMGYTHLSMNKRIEVHYKGG